MAEDNLMQFSRILDSEHICISHDFVEFITRIRDKTSNEDIKENLTRLLEKNKQIDHPVMEDKYFTVVNDLLKLNPNMTIEEYEDQVNILEDMQKLTISTQDIQRFNVNKASFDFAITYFLNVIIPPLSFLANFDILSTFFTALKDIGYENLEFIAQQKKFVIELINVDKDDHCNLYHIIFDFGRIEDAKSNRHGRYNPFDYFIASTIINRVMVKKHYLENQKFHNETLHAFFGLPASNL